MKAMVCVAALTLATGLGAVSTLDSHVPGAQAVVVRWILSSARGAFAWIQLGRVDRSRRETRADKG